MKTILDKTTLEELVERIRRLDKNATARWGKMNVHQMVRHCSMWEELMLGKKKYRRSLAGYLFGKIALNSLTKDDKPLTRNTPTIRELKIKDTGDFEAEKARWISMIEEQASYSGPDIMHPFFGKMTREQSGYLLYKHTDHHLRQFGV